MKASYMPLIEKKLETYKDMNNLSDSEIIGREEIKRLLKTLKN